MRRNRDETGDEDPPEYDEGDGDSRDDETRAEGDEDFSGTNPAGRPRSPVAWVLFGVTAGLLVGVTALMVSRLNGEKKRANDATQSKVNEQARADRAEQKAASAISRAEAAEARAADLTEERDALAKAVKSAEAKAEAAPPVAPEKKAPAKKPVKKKKRRR